MYQGNEKTKIISFAICLMLNRRLTGLVIFNFFEKVSYYSNTAELCDRAMVWAFKWWRLVLDAGMIEPTIKKV